MASVWLNGSFVGEEQAAISVRDTGLLHAAGVFTTMRAYGGKVFRLDRHLARLRHSCEVLFIPLPYKDEELTSAVGEMLARDGLSDARIRVTVTRGSAKTDPIHGLHLSPTVLITATALEMYPAEFYARGMTVVLIDEQKLNPYDLQAGHKTLNYFSRLAALRSANQRAAREALWFNLHNYLESGSISNVFIVSKGKLVTPPTNLDLQDEKVANATAYPRSCVLPGVTRATLIELAEREGIEVERRAINVSELLEAEEVFLTNSIMQVMPVCRVERRAIGDDRPGKVTQRLTQLYQKTVDADK